MVKVALAQINATVGDLPATPACIAAARARPTPQGRAWCWRPNWPDRLPARRPAAAPGLHAGLRGRLQALAAELADCEGLHVVVGHPHAAAAARRC
jgi:NAD+ synthase (glutamine-hydrolysing)